MKIYCLVTASVLIVMGFNAAALPQVDKTRDGAMTVGNGGCMHSTERLSGKYPLVKVEFMSVWKTPERLAVGKSLNLECRLRSGKVPNLELKFLVRPQVVARLRRT